MNAIGRRLLAMLGMATLTACSASDSTFAPPIGDARSLLASGEVAGASVAAPAAADTGRAVFTIGAQIDTVAFGRHMIAFGANSVCDPAVSSYGPMEWLQPCRPIVEPIRIEVKWWTDSRGFARAEFQPKLRFNPESDVWLFFHEPKGAPLNTAALLYCPDGGTYCTNESATDPTLRTFRDPANHCVYRRLRHFSGYNVWA